MYSSALTCRSGVLESAQVTLGSSITEECAPSSVLVFLCAFTLSLYMYTASTSTLNNLFVCSYIYICFFAMLVLDRLPYHTPHGLSAPRTDDHKVPYGDWRLNCPSRKEEGREGVVEGLAKERRNSEGERGEEGGAGGTH